MVKDLALNVGAAASVALGTCWPDHLNGDSALAGECDHIGGAAEATGWLAVPDGPKFVSPLEHELTCRHMRLGCGLGEIQPVHRSCLGKQPVIFRPCPRRQTRPVLNCGNDGFDATAEIKECASHNLVGSISEESQPDHIGGLPGQCRLNGHID
jgi:hypothetical protein